MKLDGKICVITGGAGKPLARKAHHREAALGNGEVEGGSIGLGVQRDWRHSPCQA